MIAPTPIPMTGNALESFKSHLHSRIQAIKNGLQPLHETKLPEWRRMYEARPREKQRTFPFRNASNLVVPLCAIHSDTLLARIMASIWRTLPVYPVKLFGIYDDLTAQADDIRAAWESYLGYNAIEPEELDLFRVEEEWIGEIVRYGTSVIKVCNEQRFDDLWVPAGDGQGKGDIVTTKVYDGPKPQKLALEDFGIQPSVARWEDSDIMYHRVRLQKWQLMDRRYRGIYDPAKVDAILNNPDRTSVDYVTQQREEDSQIKTSADGYAEWDIYECWLSWRAPGQSKAPRVIAWFHYSTNTLLRVIYDFYPDRPFVLGRLLYRDDSVFGYGLCEKLASLQEEISMIHNGRRDMMTVVNTKVWRVNPTSKLHEGYEIYPSAMLPAEKDEIEPLAQGEPMTSMPIDEERMALDLAERLSGVSPPMQGYGAAQEGKGGGPSAAGTLSMLQEGNNRTDLNVADIRYAHLKIGRICARQYAIFGLDSSKLGIFGAQKELIEQAASLVKSGRLGLVVSTSTASLNKEIEKQNEMMLSQMMTQHYSMIGQLIQGVMSSVTPQPLKDYLIKVIDSSDRLTKKILRTFDVDDADALVPKAMVGGGTPNAGQNNSPGNVQQGPVNVQPTGGRPVLQFPQGVAGPGGGGAPQGQGSGGIVPSTGTS